MAEFRVRFHNKEISDLVVEASSLDYISDEGALFYVFSDDEKNPMGSSIRAIVNYESVLYIKRMPSD